MVIDRRRKRFVMNMQLRQCFARAKSDFSDFFYFQKKAKVFKTVRISKVGFKKGKLATLLYTEIENANKVRKNTFNFLLYIEAQKT